MRYFLLLALVSSVLPLTGAESPRSFAATACVTAPAIDGGQSPGEWDAAAHYTIPLDMANPVTATLTTINADLWLMNSASQLYLALRLPDDDRQASLQPLNVDLVVLESCRGNTLAAGDDKKIVAPGISADKHFVEPGKDADDKVRHGKSAMGYSGEGTDGVYFVEMALPLDSGDGEDLVATPGASVRFNLVFVDGFQVDAAKMLIGGLFGPDLDNATNWGYLTLANTRTEGAPAASPAWLESLFPYTSEPDAFEHRLQRTEIAALDVDGKPGGEVTCQFIYPEIDGSTQTGTVKFFLPPGLTQVDAQRVPLLHVAGYEIDANGAMGYLKEGIAVSTVHAHPLNPLGRGPKLEWALLHAERRLPFVDDAQVFIQGGSAGGYMTLMTAAETFPVVCAMPMVPPVNWAYNAAYIVKSKAMAFSHRQGTEEQWLPVVAAVTAITDQAEARFGTDTESPVYFDLSPVRLIDGITTPVLAVFTTADMLVPVNQVGDEFIRPVDAKDFPAGFTLDMATILTKPEQRVRLLDVLDPEKREIFVEAVPEGTGKLKADGSIDGEGKNLPLPFSRERQWSIVVIDEGSPEPHVGHLKYAVNPDYNAFWRWALNEGVRPEQLTPGKLALMMKRYLGKQPLDFTVNPTGGKSHQGQMLDFPQAEQADVLRGLITFARDDAAAIHLAKLYSALPTDLKAFGETLGDGLAPAVRRALQNSGVTP